MMVPLHRALVATVLAGAALGCGATANSPQQAPPTVAWVEDYEALAETGCDCMDTTEGEVEAAACLEDARREIDAAETEHGGLDEVPSAVHVAHGRFYVCYREGTLDPARDLELVTRSFCGCETSECARDGLAEIERYEARYADVVLEPEQHDVMATFEAELSACREELTIPGEDWAAHVEGAAETACACNDAACASAALTSIPNYLVVLDGAETRTLSAWGRLCSCVGQFVLSEHFGPVQFNCTAR